MEEKFKPVTGVNSVEGGGKYGSHQNPGTVKLSANEVEVAKGLGIQLDVYAKQKSLILKQEKEYRYGND